MDEIENHHHQDGKSDQDWLVGAQKLREEILARRGGQFIDLEIVEQVRREREEELLALGLGSDRSLPKKRS